MAITGKFTDHQQELGAESGVVDYNIEIAIAMKILKILYKNIILLCGGGVLMLSSCDKVELRNSLEDDTVAPGPVTDVTYDALPGAATIRYSLPADNDVLYVIGEYEIKPGVNYNVKSSYYNNSLTVVGFGTTNEYNVNLYAVDRSGNRSEKKTVTVKPLSPPVQTAFATLDYVQGFGGIYLTFENAAKANLVANVLIKDEHGDWKEYDKYYTALPMGSYSVRGLDAVPTTFGISIYDRWENRSDTLIQEITPIYEAELNTARFKQLALPGDATNLWNMTMLWDGIPDNNGGFASSESFPKHFQFNLGTKTKLSRFKLWGVYTQDRFYLSGNVREFELWGSDNPDPQGSFDGWELIGTYTVIKPSGLPEGELSADDRAIALAGIDFDVSPDAPPATYLRVNILSTFGAPRNASVGDAWIRELKFWGVEQP
jgi:hypothetical protein